MQADHPRFHRCHRATSRTTRLQATLVVDRDKAATLGVDSDTLRSTLYGGFGTEQVSTIFGLGRQLCRHHRTRPAHPLVAGPHARHSRSATASGRLVPLGAFAHVERVAGQLTVNQLGQLPAVTISFNLPKGVALGRQRAARSTP